MTTSTQDAPESARRLNDLIGQESVSEWRVIDQETVDRYAAVSGDGEGEWIHLNPERAAREAPYGGTIVPGFLQVANLTRLFGETVKGFKGVDPNHALNYGFDRLRFVGPLPVGTPFRARIRVSEIRQHLTGGTILKQDVTLERQDGKPTLFAEWLFYISARGFQ
ncbi:MaoC/PaaZ C-terminal domain-containing protein [Mesorhizobium sp. 1B3]|uniref:MaoC/PaaZ C-terminal domain-containing protein n=1 Tax=Mesorhizobium sp. 1B3 TaxID=3243599 RepID=UPI003D9931EE